MRVPLRSTLVLSGVAFLCMGCGDPGYSEPGTPLAETQATLVAPSRIQLGAPAPDFQLWNLDNQPMTLTGHKGQVVMINFWATWCGPCKVEMPAMEQLYREFHTQGFEILAVSTDAQGPAVTKPFQEALGLSFPILHDSDFRVGVLYGARTLPMTFLVDRSGTIRHRIFGARDWHSAEARQLIHTLLHERVM